MDLLQQLKHTRNTPHESVIHVETTIRLWVTNTPNMHKPSNLLFVPSRTLGLLADEGQARAGHPNRARLDPGRTWHSQTCASNHVAATSATTTAVATVRLQGLL